MSFSKEEWYAELQQCFMAAFIFFWMELVGNLVNNQRRETKQCEFAFTEKEKTNSVCSQASSSLNSGAVIKPLELDFYRSVSMKTHTFAPINANQIRGSARFLLKREREGLDGEGFSPPSEAWPRLNGVCDVEGSRPARLKPHQRLGKLSFSEPLILLNQTALLVELGTFPAHTSLSSLANHLNHWSSFQENELSIRYVNNSRAKPTSLRSYFLGAKVYPHGTPIVHWWFS